MSAIPVVVVQRSEPSHRDQATVIDWRTLDADDLARVATSFRGQPTWRTPSMRYSRGARDGHGSVYVLNEESGMAFFLV